MRNEACDSVRQNVMERLLEGRPPGDAVTSQAPERLAERERIGAYESSEQGLERDEGDGPPGPGSATPR
jgi:hypothetical protein